MNTLCFDTCFNACSIAVGRTDGNRARVLAHRFERREKGHAEALFPMIEAVLAEAQLTIADIEQVATTRGPGSFTGTRTSVAAARGFALARGVGVGTVTSLELLAAGARRQLANADPSIAVAVDARRGHVYFDYFADPPSLNAPSTPRLLTPAVAARAISHAAREAQHVAVVGSGAELLADELDRHTAAQISVALPTLQPDARDLIDLAARGVLKLEAHVAPLYLRPADAKPQTHKVLPRATLRPNPNKEVLSE